MNTLYSQERWLLNSPPRHSSSSPIHSHRYSIAESTRSTYNTTLAFDRFKHLNSCTFKVPASDNGIRADAHKGFSQYPLPDERDDYTIVRRYLYNILTRAGFGTSDKYPAAVRCTVEAWYGDGSFFRAKCEDGLGGLCPEDGKDDHGVEVWFHKIIREKIDECVRSESRKLMQRERELEDAVSAASSYTGISAHEEQGMRALDDAVTNHGLPQDQRSLQSSDCSVYSREEDEVKPSNLPDRHDSARSSAVNPSATASEELASSYMDFVRSSFEAEHPLEGSPSLTTDEHQPKESSLHESLPIPQNEETQELAEKTCTDDVTTTAMASKRSFIKRTTSVKDFELKPTSSSKEIATPKNIPDRHHGGYKQSRMGVTPDTTAKPRVSRDIIRTMNELMQMKKSTQLREAPTKKPKKSLGHGIQATVAPKTAAKSRMPEVAKKEEKVVAAATAAAQRARYLKVDEARRLNHHAERKKTGFFAKVLGRMGGKKKEKYCANIKAYTGS